MALSELRTDVQAWWHRLGAAARRQGRRVWRADGRIHLAVRRQPGERTTALAPAVEAALRAVRGVVEARFDAALGVAVVRYDARRLPRPRGRSAAQRLQIFEDRLVTALEAAEQTTGFAGWPYRDPAQPEKHPGDWLPLARTLAELGLDFGSIAGGRVLRRAGIKPVSLELDVAAALDLVANVPALRKWVERRLGIAGTELALEAAGAITQTLLHGEVGAAASSLNRLLRLRELRARRRLWLQWEARLTPAPAAAAAGLRPRPLPEGPIERYSGKAVLGSLGAFAGALMATGREDAVAAVIAGVPKPARLGREAFAAHLGWRLARAGVLVLAPQALRRLDRIDCVVLGAGLGPQGEALAAAAAAAGLHCAALAGAAAGSAGLRRLEGEAEAAIRSLQAEGRGVLYLGTHQDAGFAAADCGVALCADDVAAPAGASLLGHGAHGVALIQAVAQARRASEQSIELSLAEVALGVALSSAGLDGEATRRILLTVGSTAVLATANGVRLAQELALPQEAAAQDEAPPWHALEVDEVLARLHSRRDGLSPAEAAQRRREVAAEPRAAVRLTRALVSELRNPMTPVLAVGAGLSAASGGTVDAALILGTLVVNGLYGGAERFRVENLVAALARRQSARLRVWRGGEAVEIEAADLVIGDLVRLYSGDVVPADCRIVEAEALEVDESSLTGESLPVPKQAAACAAEAVAERRSMLYEGTSITAGSALAAVVALGADTESGRAGRGGGERALSVGIEHRLGQLTQLTAPAAAAAGLLLAGVSRVRGRPLPEVISTAVGLAVAAVPEGLPLLAGLAQATVAGRLSARGVLVRNPRAVEALGRMNLLCADKTGTLTEGVIHLRAVSDGESEQAPEALDAWHRRIVSIGLRASPSSNSGEPLTHLTDRALVEDASALSVGSHDGLADWQRLHELPFEPERSFHAGLAQHRDGRLISVKGAPEVVLPRCRRWTRENGTRELTAQDRVRLVERAEALARRGFRVLAVAERVAHEERPVDEARVNDLCFHGFVGFADSVRPSARAAVDELRRAGVRVVMLTGDHPMTAHAIAADLGLDGEHGVLGGAELDRLDDAQLAERVRQVSVFARVTPAHKVRIVQAFQRNGLVVGMTGDGANDAPAIRLAEVGIALGERSTAAARGAADLVVTDGRIESIVAAVLEGRALWLSVRDAVSLLVGGNLGEILFTVIGGLAGERSPLNARQLLLVNLLTDAVPALAVALRPPADGAPEALLKAGPESSLGGELYQRIGRNAAAAATGATLAWLLARLGGNRRGADTVGLLALTGTQFAQMLMSSRGDRSVTLTSLGSAALMLALVENPVTSGFFGCRPLGPLGLAQAAAGTAAGAATQALLSRLLPWWQRRSRVAEAEAQAEPAAAPAPPRRRPAGHKRRAGSSRHPKRAAGRRKPA